MADDTTARAQGSGDLARDAPRKVGAWHPLPPAMAYHGPIWHFTNANALVSILTKNMLWASAATMMNDPRELTYGAKRIKRWYDNHGDEVHGGADLHLILNNQLSTIVRDVAKDPAFVISASTHHRVLNQWRHYSDTDGVAIRLHPDSELTPVDPPMMNGWMLVPQWVKVAYAPVDQDDRIRRVLTGLTGRIGDTLTPGNLDVADSLVAASLAALAASLKDEAYAEEKEVRLISYIPEGRAPLHRGTPRGVIPYIEIIHYENFSWELSGLRDFARENAPLPILEARVGPPKGRSERQRIVGVNSLFSAHDYEIPVSGSDIAYLPSRP